MGYRESDGEGMWASVRVKVKEDGFSVVSRMVGGFTAGWGFGRRQRYGEGE